MSQSRPTVTARRRAVLATLATGVAGLSGGCMRRIRTVAGWESSTQVSLEIKTVPADADPYALRIARQVAEWLRVAGIDAQVTPMDRTELLRQVLIQNDFDLFVARLPDRFRKPTVLYPLLHSRFADAAGWQNPFGYTNLDVDDMLETIRAASRDQQSDVVARLQRTVARTQPFTVIAFPDDIRAARSDHYTNWRAVNLRSPEGYLSLERVGDGEVVSDASDAASTLRVAVTDRRPTENLNPLTVEFRHDGLFTGLLYDSLGRGPEGRPVEPWMAESWAFSGNDSPHATVRLRSGLSWHDGEPVTASDVEFTHRLLADTSLSSSEEDDTQIPAPRFQGRNSLVTDVEATDERTVEFDFVECDPRTATEVFTVPVLPEHVWAERTGRASVSGIEVGAATEAIVTDNIPPVGSGPLAFVQNTPRENLVLERFDDHFLGEETTAAPAGVVGLPDFERLSLRVAGSDVSAVGMVADDDADVTGTTVGATTVPRIGRANDLELLVRRSNAPFVLGYNTRQAPLTNPRFRNTLARLVDQSYLANEVFLGYAQPAVSPLSGTDWLPSDLRWDGENPVTPFLGSDGEVDVSRARDAFREAGYQYVEDRLVQGG